MSIDLLVLCHLSHLTSCTPSKSYLSFSSSFTTVIDKPALNKLLLFFVPNLMSIFLRLGCLSKESVQLCPIPKLKDHPLSAVHPYLFNIFTAILHIRRPSPPSEILGHAVLWWQGTHLCKTTFKKNLSVSCSLYTNTCCSVHLQFLVMLNVICLFSSHFILCSLIT
jgi:hypothetical protein